MWWRSKHTYFTFQSACHSDYPCRRGMSNAYYVCHFCHQTLLRTFCACLTHLLFQTLRKQVTHVSQHGLMRLKHEKQTKRHNKNRFRKTRICDRRITEKRQISWWGLYSRFTVITTVVLYPTLPPEHFECGYIHPLIFYLRENVPECLKLDNLVLLSREACDFFRGASSPPYHRYVWAQQECVLSWFKFTCALQDTSGKDKYFFAHNRQAMCESSWRKDKLN